MRRSKALQRPLLNNALKVVMRGPTRRTRSQRERSRFEFRLASIPSRVGSYPAKPVALSSTGQKGSVSARSEYPLRLRVIALTVCILRNAVARFYNHPVFRLRCYEGQ